MSKNVSFRHIKSVYIFLNCDQLNEFLIFVFRQTNSVVTVNKLLLLGITDVKSVLGNILYKISEIGHSVTVESMIG